MRRTVLLLWIAGAIVIVSPLAANAKKKKTKGVDHSDPVHVLEAVFRAAQNADPSALASLCDPEAENDGDTRDICKMTKQNEGWDEFVAWFEKAEVSAEAVINGERATVPFTFGPDGTRKEEMRLVQRGGKWYLSSF